jgi:hypothetical protein
MPSFSVYQLTPQAGLTPKQEDLCQSNKVLLGPEPWPGARRPVTMVPAAELPSRADCSGLQMP